MLRFSITDTKCGKYTITVYRDLGNHLMMGPDRHVITRLQLLEEQKETIKPDDIVDALKDLMDLRAIGITLNGSGAMVLFPLSKE